MADRLADHRGGSVLRRSKRRPRSADFRGTCMVRPEVCEFGTSFIPVSGHRSSLMVPRCVSSCFAFGSGPMCRDTVPGAPRTGCVTTSCTTTTMGRDQQQTDHPVHRPSRPHARSGRGTLRTQPPLSLRAAPPLPHRRRRRDRSYESAPAQQPANHTGAHRRPRPAAPAVPHRAGPGRGRGHDRLAPREGAPQPTIPGHDPPDPPHRRARHRPTPQAAPLVLAPLRSRATERDLAIRLHPLAVSGRHQVRDPELAR